MATKYRRRRPPHVVYEDVTDQAPCFPFYFRQVLAGPHENFHYVIGDPRTKVAAVIDPAFELDRIFSIVERDGYSLRHALFTHGHWDHIGGAEEVVARGVTRLYVHEAGRELPAVDAVLDAGAEVGLAEDGDVIQIGDMEIEWLHTPGHQPEGSCFIASAGDGPRALFGGDTLFVDTCGRTDFKGGDTEAMFGSMQRLRALAAEDLFVMPGHHYADRTNESLALQVQKNPALGDDRAAFDKLACLSS